jgi:cytosine/adenosine deaminase-related metal-dependent hydrolase
MNALESDYLEIAIEGSRISRLSGASTKVKANSKRNLDLTGFLVLPGLINAHDHLEFNCFPRLGRGVYPNATAWSTDIYHPHDSPIREHLTIQKRIRLIWGGVKNLLNGVTSVSHHNPYEPQIFGSTFPVRVIKRFGWAHSVDFSPDLEQRFKGTPKGAPFIVHAAEGTDKKAHSELKTISGAGALSDHTVLVHGVGIDGQAIEFLKEQRVSIIWCPTSNLFTLGRTISKEVLESGIAIALGTDSALTAAGDLIAEMQAARAYVGAPRIYEMVTTEAAAILRLNQGEGRIVERGRADLLIVRDTGQTPADALTELHPELVILGGRIKLISPAMAARLRPIGTDNLRRLNVEGRGEWLIDCDVLSLTQAVRLALGPTFQLARNTVRP